MRKSCHFVIPEGLYGCVILVAAFACVRRSATDLPVLNMSAAKAGESLRIVAGSRPKRAQRFTMP